MTVVACPSPAPLPVRGIVEFDATEFRTAYPGFTTVSDALLQGDFDTATLFLNNSCCSVVKDANVRQKLLYMVTAHIAYLLQGYNGKPPTGIVGRIDKASQGSVSASASYASEMSMSEAYFAQSPFGVMFWQATVGYRGFTTIVAPQDACIGAFPGFQGPFGFGRGNCC